MYILVAKALVNLHISAGLLKTSLLDDVIKPKKVCIRLLCQADSAYFCPHPHPTTLILRIFLGISLCLQTAAYYVSLLSMCKNYKQNKKNFRPTFLNLNLHVI